jgi:DNA-binding NarL/FixJ family response regulator
MANKGAPGPPAKEEQGGQKLGVVIVEPLPIVGEGLRLFIDAQPDMDVLAQASSADEALHDLDSIRKRKQVIVLVAMELSGEHDGFWLIRTIRETHPTYIVIGVSVNSVRMNVTRALFMGADGYINKQAEPADFLDALRRAADGEMPLAGLPPDWFGPIVDQIVNEQETQSTLTGREQEILTIAAEGLTARNIGDVLGLSERTITTHLANIYKKLGVHGRGAAVAAAARAGLVALAAPQ